MSILTTKGLLTAVEKKIESGLTAETRSAYERIVVAGLKVGLHDGEDGILASVSTSKDPISDCAVGAVNLVMMMRRESRGTMPEKAMVPAAMVLMLKALDFVDKARIAKIGNDEVNRATRICMTKIFEAFNITPQMLKAAGSNVREIMNDPAKMDLLGRKAGVLKAQGGAVPSGIIGGGIR